MNQNQWLATHPYLKPAAELHAAVDAAAAELHVPTIAIPGFENYLPDYQAGVPLLQSDAVEFDFAPMENLLIALTKSLASASLPGNLAAECRSLVASLQREDSLASARLCAGDLISKPSQGLVRFLGWTTLELYLRPLLHAFAKWLDQDRWFRAYCPACGSPPAMAQLVSINEGRGRYFSCGCCRTSWLYHRRGCPFCGEQNDQRLGSMSFDRESGIRIDYCSTCGSYLKTCSGEGAASSMLSDWSSIHLDIFAIDRGFKRSAASLYEI
jgi:FdhE protein